MHKPAVNNTSMASLRTALSTGYGRARVQLPVLSSAKSLSALYSQRSHVFHAKRPKQHQQSTAVLGQARRASSSPYKHVKLETTKLPADQGSVAVVKLSNPKKLNIVNSETLTELKAALESIQYDDSLRVVVLTGDYADGSTHAFCGGADIREMGQISSSSEARAFITKIYDVCEAIRNIPAITIARIDGVCLGAGLEMVAACDFRYATQRSRFSMPEVKIGIPSVVHARSLINIMGWQQAKKLMAFADILSASEAEAAGLLDKRLETTEDLDAVVQDDIEILASHGRKGMHTQKKLFKAWEESDFHAGLRTSIDAFADSYADGGREPRSFMNAWIEKKKGGDKPS